MAITQKIEGEFLVVKIPLSEIVFNHQPKPVDENRFKHFKEQSRVFLKDVHEKFGNHVVDFGNPIFNEIAYRHRIKHVGVQMRAFEERGLCIIESVPDAVGKQRIKSFALNL